MRTLARVFYFMHSFSVAKGVLVLSNFRSLELCQFFFFFLPISLLSASLVFLLSNIVQNIGVRHGHFSLNGFL